MDVVGLRRLMADIETGRVEVHLAETTEPSPLSHEILNGKPFTFLDDAPLEERRTRAVSLPRGLPVDPRNLTRLDDAAIDRVRDEAQPQPRDAEELHDLLHGQVVVRPRDAWRADFERLRRDGRACLAETSAGAHWVAAERIPMLRALFPEARCHPELRLPEALERVIDEEEALAEALRGHLDGSGPCTIAELDAATGLGAARIERGLAGLEAEGFVLRGHFDARRAGELEFCARRLLARVHAYTRERLRREIEPVTAQDYVRFLVRWQHVALDTRREGRRGTLAAIEQLQGFELAAGAWESEVLSARVAEYRSEWLDALCLSGEVAWGRLAARDPQAPPTASARRASPSRVTPITLACRDDLPWLLAVLRGSRELAEPTGTTAAALYAELARRGALFHGELVRATGADDVGPALWELVGRGLVTSDGFESLRSLLGERRGTRGVAGPGARARLRRRPARGPSEGRWSRLPEPAVAEPDELAEALAEQLLARWGVVFFDVLTREDLALSWRELLLALRRLEARGVIRGGRFVSGFSGEQFALPGALDALRRVRRLPRNGETVELSAVDPLNLAGILTPGARVAAQPSRRITIRDGLIEELGGETLQGAAS
jgi:ATP-dependent Lhr-like helicase